MAPGVAIMRLAVLVFCIATAVTLAVDMVLLGLLGLDCDSNTFWVLLNLPGLPCGIGGVILGGSEYRALVTSSVVACVFWGALGAGVAQLIRKLRAGTGARR